MTTKHNLKHNGAAYNEHAELINPDPKVTSGEGRALCTCGAISDPLPTGGARRAWHKEHKATVAVQEEAPAESVDVFDEALRTEAAKLPENRSPEPLAQAAWEADLPEAPAAPAPKKVSRRRKAEQAAGFMPELDQAAAAGTTVAVPFTNTVSPHFWFQLGRPSGKVLAEKYPELQVGHDDKTRTITVTGEQGLAQLAAAELAATWAAAPAVFTEWKRDTPAYANLKHTVAEDRRTSYQLTKAFWGNFAREQLLG